MIENSSVEKANCIDISEHEKKKIERVKQVYVNSAGI